MTGGKKWSRHYFPISTGGECAARGNVARPAKSNRLMTIRSLPVNELTGAMQNPRATTR
jgi:hypothetical protein